MNMKIKFQELKESLLQTVDKFYKDKSSSNRNK